MLRITLVKAAAVAALPLVALGTAHGIQSQPAESHSSTTSVTVVASGPDDNRIWG
ncbi:hypothetical protein ACF07V_33515 [Streptomyces sp. NPDC015661]|uniref:hypothetical protein n=1 Tax=Streptomyces sp. NPDC015661 TaxID=3364961 RepID=UPI0036FB37DF